MSSLAEDKKYNYRDYLTWDDETRYEIIDGFAYAMASPSHEHQKISKKLFRQIDNFLTGKTCEVYYAPHAVRLNADNFDDIVVEPDIFVVCDTSKFDNRSFLGAPDMVIEILSVWNKRHDTVIKFRQYQKAGVREYWIVDPVYMTVEVYILKKNGKYGVGSVYRDDDVIPVHILDGCEINLADVFYDTIESGESGESENNEAEIKQKIMKAMKEIGLSNEEIEKFLKI